MERKKKDTIWKSNKNWVRNWVSKVTHHFVHGCDPLLQTLKAISRSSRLHQGVIWPNHCRSRGESENGQNLAGVFYGWPLTCGVTCIEYYRSKVCREWARSNKHERQPVYSISSSKGRRTEWAQGSQHIPPKQTRLNISEGNLWHWQHLIAGCLPATLVLWSVVLVQ